MAKKVLICCIVVMCLSIYIFMRNNHVMYKEVIPINTEYGLRMGTNDLYTFCIDGASKIESESDYDVILIDYTYSNKNVDKEFIIDQNNFECTDSLDKKMTYTDNSKIKRKPLYLKKGDTYSAQVTYKVSKSTEQVFLRLHTSYTDSEITFQVPIN